jgi:hypothetical protein
MQTVLEGTGASLVSNFGIPWGGYRFLGSMIRNFIKM